MYASYSMGVTVAKVDADASGVLGTVVIVLDLMLSVSPLTVTWSV